MKTKFIKSPRKYAVGLKNQVTLLDCGQIYLKPDEQITFVTPHGKKYDFTAKSWGFYVTQSMNVRLKKEGFKVALVKNSLGRFYVMAVDAKKVKDFKKYLRSDKNELVQWLDELSA